MFCPKCAAENDPRQAYCRQCGLALADIGLAIQGAATESLTKLKSGSHLMNGGIATLASFMLIAVFIMLISITQGHPVLMAIAMLNALLGAIIGLPLVLIGKTRVTKAARLLSGEEPARAIDSHRNIQSLNGDSELGTNQLIAPGSVTEHTTLDLRNQRKT